jgi:hypothetical protein
MRLASLLAFSVCVLVASSTSIPEVLIASSLLGGLAGYINIKGD